MKALRFGYIAIFLLSYCISLPSQEIRTIETILPFTNSYTTIEVEVKDGLYYFNGDIVVKEIKKPAYYDYIFENDKQTFTQANSTSDKNRLWKKGIVPYMISSQIPSNKRQQILTAIRTLNEKTNLNIIPRTTESDYVLLRPNADGRCSSSLGRVGGRQTINVAEWCGSGSLMHEFFHAVGFYHEHNRPDRDQYIRVNWANISPDWKRQYQKVEGAKTYGQYDYESIMHYPDGNGNFDCLQSNCDEVGNRRYLTQLDINGINRAYPVKTTTKPNVVAKLVPVFFETQLSDDQVIENVIVKITLGSKTVESTEFAVSFKDTYKQEGIRLEEGKTYSYEAFVECVEFDEDDGKHLLVRRRGLGKGSFTAKKGQKFELASNRRDTEGDYRVLFQE